MQIRTRFYWMMFFLITGFLSSCAPQTTPPGANSINGSVGDTLYHYHYWEEGLGVLIWHDFSYGESGCSGSSSTEDPLYRLECNVEGFDGRNFEWKVYTRDGVSADMWIDDKPFDLSQGNLFLVTTENGALLVSQLQRDFSDLKPENESISDLANRDQDIAAFIERVASLNEPIADVYAPFQDSDPDDGLVELLNALRFADYSVEVAGRIEQPFFTVFSQVIKVNGEEVQVFEYEDSAVAEGEAALISDDASTVGTNKMSWVATPHFYAADRIIVLYLGENVAITTVLSEVLGEVIAEGQSSTLVPEPEATPMNSGSDSGASIEYHPLAGLLYSTGQDIWIIDASGEPLLVFQDDPTALLSPDGRYVLFSPEYDPDIWLADLATGERRNLTEGSNRYNGAPQWWPGQPDTIIFGSSQNLGPGFGYPTTVRLDGSDYRILDQERSGPLALSPDGEMLAYGGFDHSGRIVRRGSDPEDFFPSEYGLEIEEVFQPAWSPDGKKLAWKVSGNPETQGWSSGVAVFDLENKSAALFHTYLPFGGGGVPHYLSWSPNGDWLAFVTFNERAEDGRRPTLWIAHPDGEGEIRLGTAFESVWSPDGNLFAFSLFDEVGESFAVWLYDTVNGEQEKILPIGSTAVAWLEPTEMLFQHLQP